MRCFVAVGGETDLGGALEPWLAQTRESFPELAVTPAGNLHLTLAFLGNIDEAAAAAAGEAVDAAAATIGAGWRLGWGDPGAFPGATRPRVLWLGVGEGAERLAMAHQALVGELSARALPLDSKPYRPHLTLARVRTPPLNLARAAEIAAWLQAMPGLPPLVVDSLVLYRSTLGKPAAVHTPVQSAHLG